MKKKDFKDRRLQNEFLAKMYHCIQLFDEADKCFDEIAIYIDNDLGNETSVIDKERSDYLHLIEDYDLSDEQKIKVCRAIEDNSNKRRNYHNMMALGSVWQTHKNKIYERNNRNILRQKIAERLSNLDQEYNNRVIDDEQLQTIFKESKKEIKNRGKKPSITEDIIKAVLKLANDDGFSAPYIAEKLKIGVSTVYKIKSGTYKRYML